MKNKELFIEALSTLFWSSGCDPGSEVIWAGNDLLKWYEAEYDVKLNIRFDENNGENAYNYNEVIEAIKKS